MDRRAFVFLLGALAGMPLSTGAQRLAKLPRVGILVSSYGASSPRGKSFIAGLGDFGYADGRNITLEWRLSGGRAERLSGLAAELVGANIDVIVAVDNPSIVAVRRATETIPIVMVLATDPVGTGFVTSLARPGGNVTGLTIQAADIQGKVMQILKETLPDTSRVTVLWDQSEPERRALATKAAVAADALGLKAKLVGLRNAAELDGIFMAMRRDRSDAVLIHPSQALFLQRARIAELAAKHRLPTMGWSPDTVEAGWLMSYGPDILGLFRRAGYFVDKVLKGAKPSELPIEQPTKFDLVINLKTAKALGIAIPRSVLLRADQVIE